MLWTASCPAGREHLIRIPLLAAGSVPLQAFDSKFGISPFLFAAFLTTVTEWFPGWNDSMVQTSWYGWRWFKTVRGSDEGTAGSWLAHVSHVFPAFRPAVYYHTRPFSPKCSSGKADHLHLPHTATHCHTLLKLSQVHTFTRGECRNWTDAAFSAPSDKLGAGPQRPISCHKLLNLFCYISRVIPATSATIMHIMYQYDSICILI